MANELAVNPGPLSRFEAATDPSSVFSNRLEAAFLAAAMGGETVPVVTARPAEIGRPVIRMRSISNRRKLLDLAAVAALLLAMIGGLASTTQRSSAPSTPASIAAPNGDQSVSQSGGTGAQDYQYSGPAPSDQPYELAWSVLSHRRNTTSADVRIVGNQVFAIVGEEGSAETFVAAYDLNSGTEQWRAPSSPTASLVIDQEGVVVAVEEPETQLPITREFLRPIHFAKYQLTTGLTMWESEQVQTNQKSNGLSTIVASSQEMYLSVDGSHITALDLKTGAITWRYDLPTTPADGIPDQYCQWSTDRTGKMCFDRDQFSYLATWGTHLYFTDFMRMAVGSIDARSGGIEWVSPLATGDGIEYIVPVPLVANELGVIATTTVLSVAAREQGDAAVRLLRASDGTSVWSREFADIYFPMVSDGTSLWLMANEQPNDETEICCLRHIEVASGDVLNTAAPNEPIYPMAVLRNSDVLAARRMSQPAMINVSRTTDQETMEVTFGSPEVCGIMDYPLASDGSFVCRDDASRIRVFRPMTTDGSSPGATPEASPATSPEPGAPNMDVQEPVLLGNGQNGLGQTNLPVPEYPTAEPLWTLDADADLTPWPFVIGTTLFSYHWQDDDHTQVEMLAMDWLSGDPDWMSPVAVPTQPLVTDQGIIVIASADDSIFGPLVIRRLDSETGEVIWQSQELTLQARDSPVWLGLSGTTVIYDDSRGNLTGIDFQSGATLWNATYDTAVNESLQSPVCLQSNNANSCVLRTEDHACSVMECCIWQVRLPERSRHLRWRMVGTVGRSPLRIAVATRR